MSVVNLVHSKYATASCEPMGLNEIFYGFYREKYVSCGNYSFRVAFLKKTVVALKP
jgi:hypothetical protein